MSQFKSITAVSVGEVFVMNVGSSHVVVWAESEQINVILHTTVADGVVGAVEVSLFSEHIEAERSVCVVGSATRLYEAQALCEQTRAIFHRF
ncbi:hypothetical protein [Citrobacter portucalensis]|uniref:hypothetical protein n=1 Tax=Citrobacter portucalensis TaxID=1639133 RepID=UPI00254D3233|nr:hypothetical protein [Citrobacter portucalensis]